MTSFEALTRFDWQKAGNTQFLDLVDEFNEWVLTQPVSGITLADGWHDITPEMALQILMRNRRNRKVNWPTVAYYARQMVAHDWPPTGQPIIFTVDGDLGDAQHRLWACLLSGATFRSYVVNQQEEIPNVFAYIDNSRPRSAKDALATAGIGGALSDVMAQTITIALEYDADLYKADGKKRKLPKHPPNYFLQYAATHPLLETAANLMAGEHRDATTIISHKDVATFAAFRIIELHGEYVLDQFMEEIGSAEVEDSACKAFQVEMEKDRSSLDRWKKHQVLGLLIHAFNAWLTETPVKKLRLSVNEAYPLFSVPKAMPEAAE